MLADLKGVGEWGFSALVETDSTRILFDVGGHPTTVRDNAAELKVDLSGIQAVVLSHNHYDHTAGLPVLRQKFADGKTPIDRLHRARILPPRHRPCRHDAGRLPWPIRPRVGSSRWSENSPGLHRRLLTGPIPRKYPEKNYPHNRYIRTATSTQEDNVSEDMSMIIETPRGWSCSRAAAMPALSI